MTEDMAYVLVWVLIFAAFGLMVGWALGDEVRRRRCAEDKVDELRDQLQHAGALTQERQLKEMRAVLNDAHRHILAVSKGLAKLYKINGRISPIRPSQKVWVKKQIECRPRPEL